MRERLAGHGRIAVGALAVLIVAGAVVAFVSGGSSSPAKAVRAAVTSHPGEEVDLDPAAIAKERGKTGNSSSKSAAHAQVVVAVPPGMASPDETLHPSKRSQVSRTEADAQIRRDLVQFRKYLSTIPPASGKRAEVTEEGQAAVPFDAPPVVATVVSAANEIARTPYRWGGGHGAWRDRGYDCSGSVSFALAAAGLLDGPMTSGQFMNYGAPGRGKWITLYANQGHIFMVVAGIRYDTGALAKGTRWEASMRPTNGFVARHPPGL